MHVVVSAASCRYFSLAKSTGRKHTRRLNATMGGSDNFLQERFGKYIEPSQIDEKPNMNEPVFGSRFTSHDMPKTKYECLLRAMRQQQHPHRELHAMHQNAAGFFKRLAKCIADSPRTP